MLGVGISDEIILVVSVDSNDAVTAYQFITRLTVEIQLLCGVIGAVRYLLCRGNKLCHIPLESIKADYLVGGELSPSLVDFCATFANELSTVTTEIDGIIFCAFLTLHFLGTFDLLDFHQGISNFKQVMNMERWLEAGDAVWG